MASSRLRQPHIWEILAVSIFQDPQPQSQTNKFDNRHNRNTNSIQPQPEEGTESSQSFPQLQDQDSFTSSDIRFLKSI